MLQKFNDKLKGIAAFFIVGLISLTFALFGVDSLFLSNTGAEEAASVNGEPITELRVQQAVALRKQQILDRFQDMSPELINDELLREPVVDDLVRRKALELAARDGGMTISSKTIYRLLMDVESFKTEGVFDASRYEFAIRQQGYTPTSYNEMLKSELLADQLTQGLITTGFATAQDVSLLANIAEQQRDFYYLTVPVAPLLETVEVAEADIAAYYETNTDRFISEEQVVVEYIELATEQLLPEIEVDEAMLREQYEAENTTPEVSRRVAHILIENGDDSVTSLNELQEKLSAGDDFAELASEYSMDFGTAESGGDLGYSVAGDLPEAFDAALALLAIGEVSEPVVTDAGTHILKLLDEKSAEVATFEERRDDLETSLKQQLASEILLEQADELRELSYNAESLEETAAALGLELQVSAPFGRNGGEGIAQLPAVVNAAFSEDVLANGYASELMEINENRVIVLSLKQHLPAEVKPLANVKAEIESLLKMSTASEQAAETAGQLKARVTAGESIEAVAKSEGLEWQVGLDTGLRGGNVDAQVRQHVFSLAAPSDNPVVSAFSRDNGDHIVVSLVRVELGDAEKLSDDQRSGLAASAAVASSNRDYQSYERMLVAEADISR